MPINYCLPLIATSSTECRDLILQQQSSYKFFEIWLDYLADAEAAINLCQSFPDRLIFLFRRLKLEAPQMLPEKRRDLIKRLIKLPALIDFDFLTQQQDLEEFIAVGNANKQLLLSYHNYQSTPEQADLQVIIDKMLQYNPAILKLACFCQDQQAALRLMQMQQNLIDKNQRVIILGMGKFGFITRVFGTMWGNEMIFAPLAQQGQTAVEQLTFPELKSIFAILAKEQNH